MEPFPKVLWTPSEEQIKQANMTKFMEYVNSKYNLDLTTYHQLYAWSIEKLSDFWATMWDYGGIIASKKYDTVVDNIDDFFSVKWFPGAELNFAENLLRHHKEKNRLAYIFHGENQRIKRMTYPELFSQVTRFTKSLQELDVSHGDCVAGYIPNLIETVIAMLAATSLGASWASCGAELGPTAVLDRFGQIKPKILIAADGYFYKGKVFSSLINVEHVIKGLPSIERVIVTPYIKDSPNIDNISRSIDYNDFLSSEAHPKEIKFAQLPFSHPGYIMFSSGTTGKPKCMVQSTGGVLLTQLRDLILHTDVKKTDRIMYNTSPSWMMWNWLNCSLAVGATILLYDGNPLYPDWGAMWKLIQDEKLTIFGTSASYLHYLNGIGAQPGEEFDLSSLRVISQTASSISSETMEWLYKDVKKDFHFNSITGGSDLNAIFAGGCPILPLYAERPIQCRALGMKIEAYDDEAKAVRDQQAELVVEYPFPSGPLYFWDDSTNKKYEQAYFSFFQPKGKIVWRHGDYIIIHSDTGGLTVFGRSDTVLKPSGVRIGTSEIYNTVETLPEIEDSLAIGQSWKGDQRIILFVKVAEGYSLTEELKKEIKKVLREKASPRHVPALILETPDIPYTFSMKKVEIAVTNIIHGKPVTNKDALSNPESLDYYERIQSELI
ncbi:MAG: acetoacetate--CoA ligase [Candidatus Heimdallarchaeota archaeon]|nr:MAG: acetoacetate--CoA ligase [Candidatus Heimdallarchaeota archaeon]